MTTASGLAPPVVSGTTPLPTSSSSGSSGSTLSSTTDATLAGNFQTFLTLLTTQLQNQNPLDPLDTNQFTQQLVQFAAALTNGSATWELGVPTNANVTISIANSTGQTVFTGSYDVNAGNNQVFTWNGKGNDGTQWPDGKYKLTATATDSAANSVAVTTQIQGVVDSVDLTQSPPLLSINGQNYTVNQIKSIAN